MKNFIKHNIDNVKGTKSMSIERQNNKIQTNKYHSLAKRSPINNRLADLQLKMSQIEESHHQQIIEQLNSIKEDIRLIKSHIFQQKYLHTEKQSTQGNAWEEDILVSNQARIKSHSSQQQDSKTLEKNQINRNIGLDQLIQTRLKRSQSNYVKNNVNFKALTSMIKDYKLQGPQFGNIFFGYSKKNSHSVAVKYSPQGLGNVLQIYDRLWKNIAKAHWPCINRILDYKSEDSTYIIMEKNKGNIVGLPPKAILIDALKIIEFIHDCGYLYRNIQPEHFMLNDQGQLVVIDFKRAKRYVDIKGRPLDVIDSYYSGSPFASNNQVRGLPQSRKDDLQSLGYLALLLLQLQIPWMGCNKQQTIKIRSTLTLQQLFKTHMKWVQYMAVVMKIGKSERPDYKRLIQILQLS